MIQVRMSKASNVVEQSVRIIIIIITDLYSAFRSKDTEVSLNSV